MMIKTFSVKDPDYPVPICFIGSGPSCIQCTFGHIVGDFEAYECGKTGEVIDHRIGDNECGEKCPLLKLKRNESEE